MGTSYLQILAAWDSQQVLLAQLVRGPGNYINWLKLGPVIALYLLWVYTTNWVEKDLRELRGANRNWMAVVFFPGMVGIGLAFLVPFYWLQLPLFLLLWAVPLFSYVHYRNEHVGETEMVTVASVVEELLSKVGIDIGGQDEQQDRAGPPITIIAEKEDRVALAEEQEGWIPAKELLYDAIVRRATEVLLDPGKEQVEVRYCIDGVMMRAEGFDQGTGDLVYEVLKMVADMNPQEKRKPQQGSFVAELKQRKIGVHAASQGSMQGERLSLKILDQTKRVQRLDELGLREKTAEQLRELIKQKHGLIVMAAPGGSGRSTTLNALIREIDRYLRSVAYLTNDMDDEIDNVQYIDYSKQPDVPLAQQLRSLLRQMPDVVLIGELEDPATAEMAIESAATDQLILSTIDTRDSISGLKKLIEMHAGNKKLADALLGVISQRLVRKLCPHCKEAYHPKPEFLKKANLPASKIKEPFYRQGKNPEQPCPRCDNMGYRGRTAILELLVINDALRELLRTAPSLNAIKAEARKNGMIYLKEDGLRQVIRGVTSVDELMRVFK